MDHILATIQVPLDKAADQVRSLKYDIKRLEVYDRILEKHITNKFEETNSRQLVVNKTVQKDLSDIKASIAKLTGDGEESLVNQIVSKINN